MGLYRVDYDDVQAVKFLDIALGFDKVPLADWCERRVTCAYEELTGVIYCYGLINQMVLCCSNSGLAISYHQYTGRKRNASA